MDSAHIVLGTSCFYDIFFFRLENTDRPCFKIATISWKSKIWKSQKLATKKQEIKILSGTSFQKSGYFQKSGSIFFSDQNYFFAQHPVTVSIEWEPPKVKYRPFFTSLQNFSDPNRKWHMPSCCNWEETCGDYFDCTALSETDCVSASDGMCILFDGQCLHHGHYNYIATDSGCQCSCETNGVQDVTVIFDSELCKCEFDDGKGVRQTCYSKFDLWDISKVKTHP